VSLSLSIQPTGDHGAGTAIDSTKSVVTKATPLIAFAPFDAAQAKLHQKAWADHHGVPVESISSIGMKLKVIPPGEFMMGSNSSRGDMETVGFVLSDAYFQYDEQPAHGVRITNPFYMGVHEVTRGHFAAFVNDTGYQTEAEKDGKGGWGYDAVGKVAQKPEYTWKDNGISKTDSHPVIYVSWNDAVAFINWLSKKEGKPYRLPTEAEWEYCCRAGSGTHFSSGDSLASLRGFGNVLYASDKGKYSNANDTDQGFPFDDGFVYTSPVGQYKANRFGLYDMHGNVWEWCSDWYSKDYYATSPLNDPGGPTAGSLRVYRGGGWRNSTWGCRSASRSGNGPSYCGSVEGFRIVCDIPRLNAAVSEIDKTIPAFLSEGLVAYYPFNGDANDESGNGHHGAVIESKPVADRHGQHGKAYQLDGNKSHITFPENLFGPDAPEVTLSLWITVDKSSFPFPKPIKIFLKGPSNGELALGLLEGQIDFGSRFAPRGEFCTASAAFQTESPTCVTGVYRKGKSLQLFLDGSLAAEQSAPNESLFSEPTRKSVRSAIGVVLMESDSAMFSMFKGVVDDLRIYNRALTSAEVKDLYKYELQSPISEAKSPPLAVAPFDAGQAKAHQKAWADYLDVPVESTNSIGMKLVVIPPGEFMMGSPESEPGTQPKETLHKVTLTQPFQIGTYEVTQTQYEQVMGATPSEFQCANNPVEMVSWDHAVAFCVKLSALPAERAAGRLYRLPSAAEWEYACRAGTTTAYSFGDDASQLVEYAWLKDNSDGTVHPVGQMKPNQFGLYDMHGNVWERCSDGYSPDRLSTSAAIDPTGPDGNHAFHVLCGGAWNNDTVSSRSSSQGYYGMGRNQIGFRIVRVPLP
jgi:sulfatase modifying factor 1